MLQEVQENKNISLNSESINQHDAAILSTPQQPLRSHSPLSKSEIKFDHRFQMLKSNSSPRKEHLQKEISKLRDHSKKLLDMIESMGNREAEKNKKIQMQNSIISDLKQKLISSTIAAADQIKENPENDKRKDEENEFFLTLLDELRIKQDNIENIQQKMNEMEETLKSVQLVQIKVQQESEVQQAIKQEEEYEIKQIIKKNEELEKKVSQINNYENQQKESSNNNSSNNDNNNNNDNEEIQILKQKINEYDLQFRKITHEFQHLTESNKNLHRQIKEIQAEKGSTLRAFFSFIKEIFLLVIISAIFSGVKYYISLI